MHHSTMCGRCGGRFENLGDQIKVHIFWEGHINSEEISKLVLTLKVSKSGKQFLELSILPKNERKTWKNYPKISRVSFIFWKNWEFPKFFGDLLTFTMTLIFIRSLVELYFISAKIWGCAPSPPPPSVPTGLCGVSASIESPHLIGRFFKVVEGNKFCF